MNEILDTKWHGVNVNINEKFSQTLSREIELLERERASDRKDFWRRLARLRINGEIEQTRERVTERVELESEYAQASVGVGADAHQIIADRSYGQAIHVTVDDHEVEIVRQRDAELLVGLVDRADYSAQILDVYRALVGLVLEHVVEELAGPRGDNYGLDRVAGHLREQLMQRTWSEHCVEKINKKVIELGLPFFDLMQFFNLIWY